MILARKWTGGTVLMALIVLVFIKYYPLTDLRITSSPRCLDCILKSLQKLAHAAMVRIRKLHS
jgi:hypothetical protein